MIAIDAFKGLFARETSVQILKNGEFACSTHWWGFGKIVRWIRPGDYFDVSSLWKAHKVITKLVDTVQSEQKDIGPTLQSLRVAVSSLEKSKDKNKNLEALLGRIDVVVEKLPDTVERRPFSAVREAERFIEELLQKKIPPQEELWSKFRGYTPEQKAEITALINDYFLEPLIIDLLPNLTKPNQPEKVYQETLLEMKKYFDPIKSTFGRDDGAELLDKYQVPRLVKENYFFPLVEKWLKAYQKNSLEMVDDLLKIEEVIDILEDLRPYFLEKDTKWQRFSSQFGKILSSFYYEEKMLLCNRQFTFRERPAALSDAYKGDDKKEINRWLASLHDAQTVLSTFPRQLEKYVYVGKDKVMASFLKVPEGLTKGDREIFLCWKLFERIRTYYENNQVNNAEIAASSSMVLSTLDYASYIFFATLGKLAGKHISAFSLTYEEINPNQRIGISFSCREKQPVAQWEQLFKNAEKLTEAGFLVRSTMKRNGLTSFSDIIETFPAVFTGKGFHIEEKKGSYQLYPDTWLSRISEALGARNIFSFTPQGISKFEESVDAHLETTKQETVFSLRFLERKIRDASEMKNLPLDKSSPVGIVLEKIERLKGTIFTSYDSLYGQRVAQELIDTNENKEPSLREFLQVVDAEIKELRKRNSFPVKIIGGLFSQLRRLYEEHTATFIEKEQAIYFEMMHTWIDEKIAEASSSQRAFNYGMKALLFFRDQFSRQYPEFLEKLFVEKVSPLFIASLNEEMNSEEFKERHFESLVADIYVLKDLFPQPTTPILTNLFTAIKANKKFQLAEQIPFWLGLVIGSSLSRDFPADFQRMDEWFSKICSKEVAQQLADGLRRGAGARYGESLIKQIKDFNIAYLVDFIEKEKSKAPLMYPLAVRYLLKSFDTLPKAQIDQLSQQYADLLVAAFDKKDNSFRSQGYFRPLLCAPFSRCSLGIMNEFMKRICAQPSDSLSEFLEELPVEVLTEVRPAFPEELWEDEQREFFRHLIQLEIPQIYKDKIRGNL